VKPGIFEVEFFADSFEREIISPRDYPRPVSVLRVGLYITSNGWARPRYAVELLGDEQGGLARAFVTEVNDLLMPARLPCFGPEEARGMVYSVGGAWHHLWRRDGEQPPVPIVVVRRRLGAASPARGPRVVRQRTWKEKR
jgi:hypothetical protein